jgi:hypothetical protein
MHPSRLALVAIIIPLALETSCEPSAIDRAAPRIEARDPLSLRAADEFVLDVSSAGELLLARELPVPPQSDADRLLEVRWIGARGPRVWAFDGEPVLEARFVPSSNALLVLTREHTLVRVDHPERTGVPPIELDRDALGPLSLDGAGRYVVYTRGEMPDYQLVRAEIATGQTLALAPALIPAWCPTILPDASEVLVVASPTGTPAFYRVREGRAPERWNLAPDTPLPTGPSAAIVVDQTIVYQSDDAVVSLGLDGVLRASLHDRSLPVLSADGARVLVHTSRREALTVEFTTRALRPTRLEEAAR